MASPIIDIQRGARAVAESERWAWPYPWLFPPFAAVRYSARGSIAAPALGVQTLVTSYKVPQGMYAVLTSMLFRYDGSGFVDGSGDVLGVLDVNTPIGVPMSSGRPVPYYGSILTNLGSFAAGPWPVDGGLIFKDEDEIRLKVTLGGAVAVGAPNYVHGVLNGWVWDARGRQP